MSTQDNAAKAPIVIERSYKATLKDVWDLWTTKHGFESWWGPQGFRVEVHEIDARVGGALRYDMIAATPETIAEMKKEWNVTSHETRSTFVALKAQTHLVLRSAIDFIPNVPAYDNDITVDLSLDRDHVRMVVTLSPMHSDAVSQMQKEGFTSQLTKLDERFV